MRGWLQKMVDEYLLKVAALGNSPEDRARAERLASEMREAWAEQGLSALKQQKNLMTEARNAIRNRLGENHVALETMNFSTHEWTEVNRATSQRVAIQNTKQQVLDPATVNSIVTRATQPKQPKPAKQTVEVTEEKLPTDTSKSMPERALESIMAYNDRQENHADKWVISFPVMKDLCKQLGAATQRKINEVIQIHSSEIEEHNRGHGLGERYNRVHKGASISEFIRL